MLAESLKFLKDGTNDGFYATPNIQWGTITDVGKGIVNLGRSYTGM